MESATLIERATIAGKKRVELFSEGVSLPLRAISMFDHQAACHGLFAFKEDVEIFRNPPGSAAQIFAKVDDGPVGPPLNWMATLLRSAQERARRAVIDTLLHCLTEEIAEHGPL